MCLSISQFSTGSQTFCMGIKNETMKTDLQLGNRVKVHQNTMQTVYMKTSAFSYTVEPPLTDTFQYYIESVVYYVTALVFGEQHSPGSYGYKVSYIQVYLASSTYSLMFSRLSSARWKST